MAIALSGTQASTVEVECECDVTLIGLVRDNRFNADHGAGWLRTLLAVAG